MSERVSNKRCEVSARVVNTGMGNFLCPPGHPMHSWSVEEGPYNPNGCYCLTSAATSSWLPVAVREQASELLLSWEREKLPLMDPQVKDWIAQVLGYFAKCYAGQDKATGEPSWNASDLRIMPDADPMLNADIHAGVHCIRRYYPEFQPTEELFRQVYWGTKPATADMGSEVAL